MSDNQLLLVGGLAAAVGYLATRQEEDSQQINLGEWAESVPDQSPAEQVDEGLGGSYDDSPVPDAVQNLPEWAQDAVDADLDDEATVSDGVNSPGGLPPGIDQIASGLISMGGN